MVLARIADLLDAAERQTGVDEVRVTRDELVPLLIFRQGDGTGAEGLDGVVSIVTLALEDSSQRIVRLLDLANYNGLELATRALKVEVCL
jgi:hypothetical protein